MRPLCVYLLIFACLRGCLSSFRGFTCSVRYTPVLFVSACCCSSPQPCVFILSSLVHTVRRFPDSAPLRAVLRPVAKSVSRLRVVHRPEGDGGSNQARIVGPGFQSQALRAPEAPSAAESALVQLLGAMVRSLSQHSNHTAASVNAVLELLTDSAHAGSASTMAGTSMTCPEALAGIHDRFPVARYSIIHTHVHTLTLIFRAVVFAVLRGCGEHDRMDGLIQLSVLLKTGPQNVQLWLHQPGWQLWLLDLVELEDETAVLVAAASGRAGRAAHIRDGPSSRATTGSSAIAADILAVLLVAALEMDRGWRVWLTTMGCLRQRFGSIRTLTYLRGFATVASAVIARMGSQAVAPSPFFRVNVMRSLRIADSRLEGECLARVTFAAIPVLKSLRLSGPLVEQELLLTVRLLVRSMGPMAEAGVVAEQNAQGSSAEQSGSDDLMGVVSPKSGRMCVPRPCSSHVCAYVSLSASSCWYLSVAFVLVEHIATQPRSLPPEYVSACVLSLPLLAGVSSHRRAPP